MSSQPRTHARYSAKPAWWSKIFIAIFGAVFVALAVWLVWVIAMKSNPSVSSTMATWKVEDQHSVTVTINVKLDEGAKNPRCVLSAYAEDHFTVGESSFVPSNGMNTVVIRTEREATSVEAIGCTADGQNDSR